MKFAPSLAVLSLLCATAACGSSVETDPGAGGGTTSSGTSSASVATASAGAGPTSSAATTTSSSANGGGGGTGGSGGSGEGGDVSTGEGGFAGTGGSLAQGGEGPGTGGAGGASTEPFLCGEVECEPDQVCCGSQNGITCVGADEPCQGATLTCDSAANCEGGDICCLEGDLQGAESRCTDVCEPTQAGPLQLCETAEECLEDVPCMEIFGGYRVCTDGFP